MSGILVISLLLVVLMLSIIFIPQFFIKRAIRKVIKIFRRHNAISEKSAKTMAELGLTPPSLTARMMSMRDYKPQALRLLISINIIEVTEDNKLYLSMNNLTTSPWKDSRN